MDSVSARSPGEAAELACLLEVAAPKAGNVHPGASFADVTWLDFVKSAHAIRPAMETAHQTGVGEAVLAAVIATRDAVGTNTNLGMVLLLAPLCVCRGDDTRDEVRRVLDSLTSDDAVNVYRAIRLAAPGGLGEADEADVRDDPPSDLIAAMTLAADRDAVARQYANGFSDVSDRLAPSLGRWIERVETVDQAVVGLHLEQLAYESDSLIVRKAGREIGARVQRMAKEVLKAGWPEEECSVALFNALDSYLRGDGHRRNPGTSADLVTAALYVAIRGGIVSQPMAWAGALDQWIDDGLDDGVDEGMDDGMDEGMDAQVEGL